MAIGPCRPGTVSCLNGPPCLHRARAWPSAQGTTHGPFGRAVPPVGHGHFHRAGPACSLTGKKTPPKNHQVLKHFIFKFQQTKDHIFIHIHTQLSTFTFIHSYELIWSRSNIHIHIHTTVNWSTDQVTIFIHSDRLTVHITDHSTKTKGD